MFRYPVLARYVRIYPTNGHANRFGLRADLIVCPEDPELPALCTRHPKLPHSNAEANQCLGPVKVTFAEANETCAAAGMRLCTRDEALDTEVADCCRDGCELDTKQVWTADFTPAPPRSIRIVSTSTTANMAVPGGAIFEVVIERPLASAYANPDYLAFNPGAAELPMIGARGTPVVGDSYLGDCGLDDNDCYHGPKYKMNRAVPLASDSAYCVCAKTCVAPATTTTTPAAVSWTLKLVFADGVDAVSMSAFSTAMVAEVMASLTGVSEDDVETLKGRHGSIVAVVSFASATALDGAKAELSACNCLTVEFDGADFVGTIDGNPKAASTGDRSTQADAITTQGPTGSDGSLGAAGQADASGTGETDDLVPMVVAVVVVLTFVLAAALVAGLWTLNERAAEADIAEAQTAPDTDRGLLPVSHVFSHVNPAYEPTSPTPV